MVKHTQTIRRQIADELFESVWPFCEIDAKRVKMQAKTTLTTSWARAQSHKVSAITRRSDETAHLNFVQKFKQKIQTP